MENINLNFDIDKEAEACVDELARRFAAYEKRLLESELVADEEQVENVKYVYGMLGKIISGRNVKISLKLFDPFITSGSVIVKGKLLRVTNGAMFRKCAKLADNMQMVPYLNGDISMEFAFSGLVKKVK